MVLRSWKVCLFGVVLAVAGCDGGGGGGDGDEGAPPRDSRAPEFEGATEASVLDAGVVAVRWETPATDAETPPERMVYRVYRGLDGTVDYSKPVAVSVAGASRAAVFGTPEGREASFVVRAVDEAGNEEKNEKRVAVTLADTLNPQFGGALEVEGVSGAAVDVKWAPATDEVALDHYLVYLSKERETLYAVEPREVPPTETSLRVAGLDEATKYFAAVRAIDAGGRDDRNRRVAEGSTLDVTAPTFAGIETAVAGGTAARLTWSPASDNVTLPENIVYRIYVRTDEGAYDFATPFEEVTGALTTVVQNLPPSVVTHFTVRAVDAAGNEDENVAELSATTGASADESPPVFDGATSAQTLSSTSIRVSWSAATDDLTPQEALVYDVWISRESGGSVTAGPPQYTSSPGATSFDVTGLDPTTTYIFIVRARDIVGLSDPNVKEASATTKSDDDAPAFSGASSLVGVSATVVQVNWNAAVDAFPANTLVYDVYLSTTSGGQNFSTPTVTVGGISTSVQISGLTRSTDYFAVVRVRDPDGNLNASTVEAAGATLPDTTPPVLAQAPAVNALSETSLRVTWSPATDDTYTAGQLEYLVQYRVLGAGSWTNLGTYSLYGGPPARQADIVSPPLSPNTAYQVQVIPRDGSNNVGSPSPIGSASTSSDATAPVWPSSPVAASLSLAGTSTSTVNNMTIGWSPQATDNIGVTAYQVCASTSSVGCAGASFSPTVQVSAAATSAAVNNLPIGTRYYFWVRALDAAGNGAILGPVTDTTAPAAPAAPTISNYLNAFLQTNWSATTDAVFSNLRYRIEIWGHTYASSCSNTNELAYSYPAPMTAGTTYYAKLLYGANYARIIATDGFGNESATWSSVLTVTTAAAATSILNPLWSARCSGSGCHGGVGASYAAWTTTTAKQSPSPVGYAGAAVVANNTSSRMYQRLTGAAFPVMPPSGGVPVDLTCNLLRWISSGAP